MPEKDRRGFSIGDHGENRAAGQVQTPGGGPGTYMQAVCPPAALFALTIIGATLSLLFAVFHHRLSVSNKRIGTRGNCGNAAKGLPALPHHFINLSREQLGVVVMHNVIFGDFEHDPDHITTKQCEQLYVDCK